MTDWIYARKINFRKKIFLMKKRFPNKLIKTCQNKLNFFKSQGY